MVIRKGIADNKRKERQYERNKKMVSSDETQTDDQVAAVIPIHGAKLAQKSFKLPTRLKDLLKEDGSDE